MLKNITEVMAKQKLDKILEERLDCCKCDKCREDILAYALNKLPPHYVSTDEGELYIKAMSLTSEYDFEILREIAIAINMVNKNPRH